MTAEVGRSDDHGRGARGSCDQRRKKVRQQGEEGANEIRGRVRLAYRGRSDRYRGEDGIEYNEESTTNI